ncbi:lipase/thioesterase family protein [Metarhizium rileyi]|uniref:Lipase/thioesterase family protein n=1 Tax=Metarhizium rileyi (strain RCEF 4871) TaxID=1649241 RepID=A0A166Z0R7_METRR|nr:lipase/thioesterase family protein [Metarhizium rileyi RCEF 4871]
MPSTQTKLSLVDTLDLIPGLASILTAGLVSVVTGLFRGHKDAPSFHLHVAYAILRRATARLTPLQLQFVSPLTNVVYEHYARSASIRPDTVALDAGAYGHWVGSRDAENVLIWYHDLAIFVLTYSLAPAANHPTQLKQAVSALRHVLASRAPSNVLLGGDSAGGNLVMGVLSHLAHRHEAIPALEVAEPLAGAVCIAPWTLLGEDHSQREIYEGGDLITPGVDGPWSAAFLGGADKDFFTSVSTAPRSWLAAFPVRRMLILGGGNEIMLPAIEELAENLKAVLPNVEFFVGYREAHVAPIYNLYVGDSTETQQGKKLKAWLRETL